MLDKIYEIKNFFASLMQMKGDFTLMIVPHDGSQMSRKDIDTENVQNNLRRALIVVGSVVAVTIATIITLSTVLYFNNKSLTELANYRDSKAQQEQKLQELAKNTEDVQKQLANLTKIENQIREQMQKSGMAVPEKLPVSAEVAGKGGPNKTDVSELLILEKQNANLQKQLPMTTERWSKMLATLKYENHLKEVTPVRWPVDGGYVSSEFGSRQNPFDGDAGDYHPGIDIAVDYGAPVYASASGYVQQAGWYGGYGNYVRLSHEYGYGSAYGHMSSIEVKDGEYVKQGQVIGYVGSTGYSTGPHLHYEVLLYGEQIDPQKLLKK